jgi:hypothetical protein
VRAQTAVHGVDEVSANVFTAYPGSELFIASPRRQGAPDGNYFLSDVDATG